MNTENEITSSVNPELEKIKKNLLSGVLNIELNPSGYILALLDFLLFAQKNLVTGLSGTDDIQKIIKEKIFGKLFEENKEQITPQIQSRLHVISENVMSFVSKFIYDNKQKQDPILQQLTADTQQLNEDGESELLFYLLFNRLSSVTNMISELCGVYSEEQAVNIENTSETNDHEILRNLAYYVSDKIGISTIEEKTDPPNFYEDFRLVEILKAITVLLTTNQVKLDDPIYIKEGQNYSYKQVLDRLTQSFFKKSNINYSKQLVTEFSHHLYKLDINCSYQPNTAKWQPAEKQLYSQGQQSQHKLEEAKEKLSLLMDYTQQEKTFSQTAKNKDALTASKQQFKEAASWDELLMATNYLDKQYQSRGTGFFVIPNFIKSAWHKFKSAVTGTKSDFKTDTYKKAHRITQQYGTFFNSKPTATSQDKQKEDYDYDAESRHSINR